MNEFCAAMGICNLRHLDEEIAKRKTVVERYRSHLDGVAGIKLAPVQKDVTPNYAFQSCLTSLYLVQTVMKFLMHLLRTALVQESIFIR